MNQQNSFQLITSFGIISFIGLFLVSANLYPGGSQASLHTIGFDWVHNYWCNLLNVKAMNGEINPARPYAIFAMTLLCLSLAAFFYNFPKLNPINQKWDTIIQYTGISSMFFSIFIFTEYHDLMTSIASFFGIFVLIGIIKGLLKNKRRGFIWSALLGILLLGLNNYIYYTQHYLEILPLLQKITFGVVLAWIFCLNKTIKNQED